ncbi:MAG: ABC transporter ATP-binding protein [Anaerolineae bacterium]
MPVVDIAHLKKSFGHVEAVRDVSFQVNSGEIFGLLGPNGAGKTTTIRMMLNIFRPDAGTIDILGGPMNEDKKSRIGYLPEERGLYREMQLVECLAYLARLKGVPAKEAQSRVMAYLERLDLAESAGKKVKELSRGMQQKAQLIATLVHDPDLLILDEPFQGLDPVNVRRMEEVLEGERKRGKAIIMSTHQMHQVETLCDRILLINGGRGVLYGTVEEIKNRYTTNAVRVWLDGTLESLPGVIRIGEEDGAYRLTLADGVGPQDVLRSLAARSDIVVRRFEVATPSLDDIFVSVVSGSAA